MLLNHSFVSLKKSLNFFVFSAFLMNVATDSIKPKKATKNPEKGIPSEQLELIKLIKQAANTTEEKYKILEARDKLIRLRTKKYTELSKAKVTVGTCPDMCPEKERLMRETQHQVSLYEQEVNGKGMNPFLAVKQYSRSSADQEVPLPHELRPVKVLKMTMTYLMAKIMNLCDSVDVNFAEWYHFLWDRTRGIRKDITQQELCSEEAVELVEQCARFHIHCSARLVGEDPSVFDQKINTENLTKCLQSLKYMYHDLELKGIKCKHEAEFRAYIILLNLNDGNFMWEVQQLRPEIQRSPEVRFALQVYSALDKNNYVRFFKLVHSTTYLNACILLRYFVQVRLSALKIILKCFSPRQPYKSYPLNELTDILAFENVDSTMDFIEYHGLVLSEDRTQVILDRRLFGMPEYPYALDRAINVIESKRSCSVGETICGGPLTPSLFENHVPQNSFDALGHLNVSDILLELNITAQNQTEEKPDEVDSGGIIQKQEPKVAASSSTFATLFPNVQESTERSRSPMLGDITEKQPENKDLQITKTTSSSIFAAASENIFGKSTAENKRIFGTPVLPKAISQFKFVAPKVEAENVFKRAEVVKPAEPVQVPEEPPKSDLAQILREKLEKEKQAMEERLAREREAMRKRELELEEKRRQEQLRLEKQKKEEVLRRQMEEEKRLEREMERKKRQQEQEKRRKVELEIKQSVAVTIEMLLDKVEEKIKKDKLEEIAQKVNNKKVEKFFNIWRANVKVRSRKRKAVDYCFAWVMPRTPKEEAEQLRTQSQSLVLSDIKRYKSGRPSQISIPQSLLVEKINIHNLCYNYLLGCLCKMGIKFPNELFWKVTISLPDSLEMSKNLRQLEEIVNCCIDWNESRGVTLSMEQRKTVNQTVSYCIEKKQGLRNCKTDSNAFIFIADEYNDVLQKRIYNSIVHFGQSVSVPAVLILRNPAARESFYHLEEKGLLQDYEILSGKFTAADLVELLKDAFRFLAKNLDKPPPLELDTLQSFLASYLAGDIWKRISGLAKWNCSYRDCLKSPEIAIKIHNDNLDKLKEIIFDRERKEYADFPDIFKEHLGNEIPEYLPCDYRYFPSFWASENYERMVLSVIDTFRLSAFRGEWPVEDEGALEREIYSYCTRNFKEPEKVFYKVMGVILKDVDPVNNFSSVKHLLWTDVVEVMAVEKIAETDFLLSTTQYSKSIFNQLFVVYNTQSLNRYSLSSWYYVNYPPIQSKIKELMAKHEQNVDERIRKTSNRFSLELDIDLDEMLRKVTRQIVENQERDVQRKKEIQEIQNTMSDLKESMEVQKKINSIIENRLRVALESV